MNKETYEVYNPDDNLSLEECQEIIRKSYSNSRNNIISQPPIFNNISNNIDENNTNNLNTNNTNYTNNTNIVNTNILKETSQSLENNNISMNKLKIKKKNAKQYDYYICPFIGFNCNPKLCQWTVQSCTGCSKAWMNPLRSIKRIFKCFPLDSENNLEQYAECSCCLCPCALCADTCVVCIYCGSFCNF